MTRKISLVGKYLYQSKVGNKTDIEEVCFSAEADFWPDTCEMTANADLRKPGVRLGMHGSEKADVQGRESAVRNMY